MRRQAKTSSQGKKKKIILKKNVQQFLVSPEVTLQEKPEIQEPKSRLFFFFFLQKQGPHSHWGAPLLHLIVCAFGSKRETGLNLLPGKTNR